MFYHRFSLFSLAVLFACTISDSGNALAKHTESDKEYSRNKTAEELQIRTVKLSRTEQQIADCVSGLFWRFELKSSERAMMVEIKLYVRERGVETLLSQGKWGHSGARPTRADWVVGILPEGTGGAAGDWSFVQRAKFVEGNYTAGGRGQSVGIMDNPFRKNPVLASGSPVRLEDGGWLLAIGSKKQPGRIQPIKWPPSAEELASAENVALVLRVKQVNAEFRGPTPGDGAK